MKILDTDSPLVEGVDRRIVDVVENLEGFKEVGFYHFENDRIRHSLRPLALAASSLAQNDEIGLLVLLDEMRVWRNDLDPVLTSCFFQKHLEGFKGVLPGDCTTIYAGPQEAQTVSALVLLSMWFGWTVSISGCGKIEHVEISHDGVISFFSPSEVPWLPNEFEQLCGRQLSTSRAKR